MTKRVFYGALAALGAAAVALDEQIGKPHYPMFHYFFGNDWQVAHNLSYGIFALMAAVFGYLALNVKNGAP